MKKYFYLLLILVGCHRGPGHSLKQDPVLFVGAGQSNMMLMDLSQEFSSTVRNAGYVNIDTVNASVGGTSLSQWEKGRPLYDQLIQKTRSHLKEKEFVVLLFWQGENEGRPGNADEAPTWGIRFSKFIDDVRTDLNQPDLPVFFVQLGKGNDNWPTWNQIKEEQASIQKPFVHMVKSDDLEQIDNVHFVPSAYPVMEQRLAQAFIDSGN